MRTTLESAVAAGLIAPHPERPDVYQFRHVLVREALCADQPASWREELHDRAVRVLEQLPPSAGVSASDLASHALHATGVRGGRRRAFAHSLRAARIARDRLAYENAAGWYAAALAMLSDDRQVAVVIETEETVVDTGQAMRDTQIHCGPSTTPAACLRSASSRHAQERPGLPELTGPGDRMNRRRRLS